METNDLRKCAKAVYLAVEESIAKDISANLKWAADEIEKLEAKIENQDTVISCLEEKLTTVLYFIEEARDSARSV